MHISFKTLEHTKNSDSDMGYPLSLPLTQPLHLHWLAAVVEIPPLFFPIVLTSEDG